MTLQCRHSTAQKGLRSQKGKVKEMHLFLLLWKFSHLKARGNSQQTLLPGNAQRSHSFAPMIARHSHSLNVIEAGKHQERNPDVPASADPSADSRMDVEQKDLENKRDASVGVRRPL